ncbi:MAG: hypothetical protein Q7T16_02620 [Candidatus Burarchaeum sp.]|nr:hypothetical protein [Candidatus Burarchaeum sp.]MDO8339527.1 hypothetical protein [Candidatus Burarchaeum sp.]
MHKTTQGFQKTPRIPSPATAPLAEPLQIQPTSQELMYGWFAKKGWLTKRGKPRAQWAQNPDAKAESVRQLVVALKKDPRDLEFNDFHFNYLSGLISNYYNGSVYAAVSDAFPELNILPWELMQTPRGFYESKENRIAAVKWLVEKLGKDPRDITVEDFHSNRLGGLLLRNYNDSPYAAVSEAFPELNIHPWEMLSTPRGFNESKENRIAAVKWLVEKLGKDPRDITVEDFRSNRLGGLLNAYYRDSPYLALLEAGLVTQADEAYMKSRGLKRATA